EKRTEGCQAFHDILQGECAKVVHATSECDILLAAHVYPASLPFANERSVSAVPELPEVETIRRGLLLRLVGHKIIGVRVRQPYLREKVEVDTLQMYVVGRTIADIERRAKYVLTLLRAE